MPPAAYFAPIRQIWSRATCRVSGRSTFHQFFGVYTQKRLQTGARILESRGIPSQSNDFTPTVLVPKAYENHILKNQLLVLRPDLDSSQDSRKVGQRIFQKIQKLTKLQRGKYFFTLDCNNYNETLACRWNRWRVQWYSCPGLGRGELPTLYLR